MLFPSRRHSWRVCRRRRLCSRTWMRPNCRWACCVSIKSPPIAGNRESADFFEADAFLHVIDRSRQVDLWSAARGESRIDAHHCVVCRRCVVWRDSNMGRSALACPASEISATPIAVAPLLGNSERTPETHCRRSSAKQATTTIQTKRYLPPNDSTKFSIGPPVPVIKFKRLGRGVRRA